MKKILYVDMDNVLVNFQSGIDKLTNGDKIAFKGRYDEAPGIFGPKNGVEHFEGEHIHFGQEPFMDWESVCGYLLDLPQES